MTHLRPLNPVAPAYRITVEGPGFALMHEEPNGDDPEPRQGDENFYWALDAALCHMGDLVCRLSYCVARLLYINPEWLDGDDEISPKIKVASDNLFEAAKQYTLAWEEHDRERDEKKKEKTAP